MERCGVFVVDAGLSGGVIAARLSENRGPVVGKSAAPPIGAAPTRRSLKLR